MEAWPGLEIQYLGRILVRSGKNAYFMCVGLKALPWHDKIPSKTHGHFTS